MRQKASRSARRRTSTRAATLITSALVLALVPAAASAAYSQSNVVPAAQVSASGSVQQAADDLASANVAVTHAAASLAAARAAMPAAQRALATATASLATARAAAARASAEQVSAAALTRRAHDRLASAQSAIDAATRDMGTLVRLVWAQGPYVELAALLSATTPSDFAERIAVIAAVSRSQARTLASMQQARADVALASAQATVAQQRADTARATAEAALAVATQAQRHASAAQAHVASLNASRSAALRVAERERAKVKRQYAAVLAQQRAVSRVERGAPRYRGPRSGTLLWPIPGASIVGGVGWRVHPVYGYRSCHTGMDIRGSYGTPILAAASGVVLSVVNNGAYGLHTILSHGGGLSTMYAHQSRSVVHSGELVRRGQVIGYVGASGWVTGPHLHFEVHVDGVPYDPMGWFGGTRRVVPCWAG